MEKFLKPLNPRLDRKNHATFDVESNHADNKKAGFTRFEMAGFYDGQSYTFCPSINDLFDCILTEKNRNRKIFAHNGGRFDFLHLMEYLKNVRNKEVRIIPMGPRIVSMKISHGKRGWITLQDSYTLLAYSLSELCKVFEPSTVKLTGTIDFENERVDKANVLHQQYLRADCIALYEILQKYRSLPMVKDVGLKLTRSSTALAAWRTTLRSPIRTTTKTVQEFCRKSYAGGRTEIFRQVLRNGASFDVTSLYPDKMLKPLPVELIGPSSSIEDFGFHDVTVVVPECYVPILWKKTPKLIFPTGEFRGVYFSEEIKLAVEMGAKIIKHHKGFKFSERADIFSEYIERGYRMRSENPKGSPLDILGKDLMNHCYGKFAEREQKWSLIKINQMDPATWPPEFSHFHSEKLFLQTGLVEVEKYKRSPHMLCHISSAITAWGRIDMARNIYLPYQKHLYYTDTDSGKMGCELPTKEGLGGLKREYGIKNAFYLLPKGYWEETESGKIIKKLKGFSKKSLESISYELFIKGNIKTVENKLAGFRTALIRENSYLAMLDMKKSVISEYSKRKLLAGGETRPWDIKKGKIR